DAVGLVDSGNAALRADRLVAMLDIAPYGLHRAVEVRAVGMAVDEHAIAAPPAEQLVERLAADFALDVPQRGVDRGDRAHRHGAAPPVGAAVEVLPDVFDLRGIAADQAGDHVVCEVGGDRQLAPV